MSSNTTQVILARGSTLFSEQTLFRSGLGCAFISDIKISLSSTEKTLSHSIPSQHFILRRLHSLLGLLPVGGFLLFHLWENSQSRFGQEHYNQYVVQKIQSMNYVFLLEIFVIALPILFHALYGLVVWWSGKSNVARYGYARNWMWWLQRVSGIGILLFLALHVGGTRILAIYDTSVGNNMFGHMQSLLARPEYLVAYLAGLILAVFHLCNGLWTMGISWGLLSTVQSQRLVQWVMGLAFLIISALGIHGVAGFFIAP